MKIEAGGQITAAVRKFRDQIAVVSDQGTQTFAQLNDAGNKIGSGLHRFGIAHGDRVGILSYNRIEALQTWIALEKWNFVRVVLHSHFDMAVHVQTLNDVSATVLMFDTRFSKVIDKARSVMPLVKLFVAFGPDVPPWAVSIGEVATKGVPREPRLEVDEETPCFLQLTTGTTGNPKPWIATYRSWRAVISGNIEHLDTFGPHAPVLGPQDVNLHFHSLQWATGFQTLMPYMLRGATTVLLDDEVFDPKAVIDAIVTHRVTGTFVPGPMMTPLLDEVERRGGIEHQLKRVMVFFGTPDMLRRTSLVLGSVWCHGFGSTEQGAPTTRITASEAEAKPERLWSVGQSISPFFEVAVMNELGHRLGSGEVGEIVVRSPMSSSRYWDMPETTMQSFFEGGWFRPRDVGHIDDDGFLYFLDRSKDRIVTKDGVVYPHVVEAALFGHSAVANCGVVGIGEPGEQTVVAAVLLKEGNTPTAEIERSLLVEMQAGLMDMERAQSVVFVESLPTVLGGAKVQRSVLKHQLVAKGANQ